MPKMSGKKREYISSILLVLVWAAWGGNQALAGAYVDSRYMVGGVSYEVQMSADLGTWFAAPIEELSTVPAGDGMEDITVRVISTSSRGFLRLNVSQ